MRCGRRQPQFWFLVSLRRPAAAAAELGRSAADGSQRSGKERLLTGRAFLWTGLLIALLWPTSLCCICKSAASCPCYVAIPAQRRSPSRGARITLSRDGAVSSRMRKYETRLRPGLDWMVRGRRVGTRAAGVAAVSRARRVGDRRRTEAAGRSGSEQECETEGASPERLLVADCRRQLTRAHRLRGQQALHNRLRPNRR